MALFYLNWHADCLRITWQVCLDWMDFILDQTNSRYSTMNLVYFLLFHSLLIPIWSWYIFVLFYSYSGFLFNPVVSLYLDLSGSILASPYRTGLDFGLRRILLGIATESDRLWFRWIDFTGILLRWIGFIINVGLVWTVIYSASSLLFE